MAQSLAKQLNTVLGAGVMRLTKKSKGTNWYGNTGVYRCTTQVAMGYECWKSYFVTNIHCHLHLLSLFVHRVSLHKHGQFFVRSRTLFTSVFCTNTEVRHLVTFFYLVLTYYYLVCLWARLVNTHSVLNQTLSCLWARLVVRANLTKMRTSFGYWWCGIG